jgi:cullin-associated NEDD8-dissociated protein 2
MGLTLLLLGELGRVSDLSGYPDVVQCIVDAFSDKAEEVKATASLALGGVGVGNLQHFLPLLLGQIEGSSKPYLHLKALNELLRSLLAKQQSLSESLTPFSVVVIITITC